MPKSKKRALKLLVVGFDGMEQSALELPLLKKLSTGSRCSGKLRVFRGHKNELLKTSPNWPSFYTGVQPWRHGVPPFDRWKKNSVIQTMATCKYKCSWDVLDEAGYKCAVLWMPLTYPVWPLKNGAMVAGFPTPNDASAKHSLEGNFCYPPGIDNSSHDLCNLRAERISPDAIRRIEINPKLIKARDICNRIDANVLYICFTFTDRLIHYKDKTLKDVKNVYKLINEVMKKLLDNYVCDTIMLVSDHGATAGQFNDHSDNGGYLVRSKSLRPRTDMTDMRIDDLYFVCLESCLGEKNVTSSQFKTHVKQSVYISTVGAKDSGKSTLTGKIFQELGKTTVANPVEVVDALSKEKQTKGTIQTGHNKLTFAGKGVVFADNPGDKELIEVAQEGVRGSDAAILLVDAPLGIVEQTKKHIGIIKEMNVGTIICAINKMDLVGYKKARFLELREQLSYMLRIVKSVIYVPISALHGHNITKKSSAMGWYNGGTLLDAIAATQPNDGDIITKSKRIIRDAFSKFSRPLILWAGGKDSTTMLSIFKEEFGYIPCPVVMLDTSYQSEITHTFMKMLSEKWKFEYTRYRNEEALVEGVHPKDDPETCCHRLKTEALKQLITKNNYDCVFVGIRWDEHGVRGKESFFSERDDHTRVHPILHWSWEDIWDYINTNKIPANPLYSKKIDGKSYLSIGCEPCTEPVALDSTVERAGRRLDKEQMMESLRALGYM